MERGAPINPISKTTENPQLLGLEASAPHHHKSQSWPPAARISDCGKMDAQKACCSSRIPTWTRETSPTTLRPTQGPIEAQRQGCLPDTIAILSVWDRNIEAPIIALALHGIAVVKLRLKVEEVPSAATKCWLHESTIGWADMLRNLYHHEQSLPSPKPYLMWARNTKSHTDSHQRTLIFPTKKMALGF